MSLELNLTDGDEELPEQETRWEGYSDYRTISIQMAKDVGAAVDAYAYIDSAHAEGAPVSPEDAREARRHILSAAMKLVPELAADRESVEEYDEILSRWQGGPEEDGYIKKLSGTQLKKKCPRWLFNMVLDIRTAAWELGYLRAGRERDVTERDPVEEESDEMLKE